MQDSVNKLSVETGIDPRTLRKILIDTEPVGTRGKSDLYDLKQVINGLRGSDGKQSPAKKRLEKAKAELAEIELEEKRGTLVSLAEVSESWGRIVIAVKTNFLVLPHRLVQLLGLSNSDRDTIDREVKTILENLSNEGDEAPKRDREDVF